MYEDAQKILEYLPIRASKNETDYIYYLWASFKKLHMENEDEVSTKSFSIMPFHILFMLTLQYKVLRIKIQRSKEYEERINKYPRENYINDQLLSTNSVFDLGLLSETSLSGVLNIIELPDKVLERIKILITHRNDNVAHAKGGFIFDVDEKIKEYLNCLSEIQKYIEILNNEIAKDWLQEIEDEEDLNEFKERKLASSYICNEDFHSGDMQLLVNSSETPFYGWFIINSDVEEKN